MALASKRFLLAIGLVLMAAAVLHADVMTMRDGRVHSPVRIDSYSNEPGSVILMVRTMENGTPSEAAHPVPLIDVSRIEFRTPEDSAATPQGREATMVLTNGDTYPGVTVVGAAPSAQGMQFYVRAAETPPGGQSSPVFAANIHQLDFTGQLAQQMATPTPSPTPEFGSETDESWDDSEEYSEEDYGSGEEFSWDEFDSGEDPGMTAMMDKMAGGVGVGVMILVFAASLIIGSIVYWILVMVAAKTFNVTDFSWLKGYGTAWMLMIAPPIAANIVMFIGQFIPFLGCTFCFMALFAWYFTARAIVMGMMEVDESEAFWIILFMILLYVAIIFVLIMITGASLTMLQSAMM